MEQKQAYEKPSLRKVRLEVKTSVLAACHTSLISTPNTSYDPNGSACKILQCATPL